MSTETKQPDAQERNDTFAQRTERVRARMAHVDHKILVLSGKGGVGKSTVAVNLAAALQDAGKRTGILDVDIHGPSVPRLLGLEGQRPSLGDDESLLPIDAAGIGVMSIGFLLKESNDAVIWRGPMKHNVIVQLLGDVDWGKLDYLIVDAPPGTGDEPMSVCQLLPDADGAVVVTTPQEISISDVRRSISFCKELEIEVLGVVENMSGFVCPRCNERVEVFGSGGGARLAAECGVPFLGAVPLDPRVAALSDEGVPFIRKEGGSAAAQAFSSIVTALTTSNMGEE